MKYEVLDSDKDLVKWKKTLSLLSDELQDIYFYPEYVGMHKFIKGTKSLLFAFKEEENIWLHPFLLHPIDSDAFSLIGGPLWFDIESAYGYGGPLSNTEDKDFLDNANEQFSEWCMENNVVAEFVRFHPIIENEKWTFYCDSKTRILAKSEKLFAQLIILKNFEMTVYPKRDLDDYSYIDLRVEEQIVVKEKYRKG